MERIATIEKLEDQLSEPTPAAVEAVARMDGGIILLGVGGKMGPSLAHMTRRASQQAGSPERRVVGVSRFSDPAVRAQLETWGVETLAGDLLDPRFVAALPEMPNVIYMAGRKFGTAGAEPVTWATNAYLPGLVCQRFASSRIAAFSTGNVYPLVPVDQGHGSVETDPLRPVGEYAMSCLGRERMFQYASRQFGTRLAIIRLNYAIDLRYGVLVDLAQRVFAGQPITLEVGYANVIWQGDANAYTLCALADATTPPLTLNVTGPDRISCREVCQRFGTLFHRPVHLVGNEGPTALLSDARLAFDRYGLPRVELNEMINSVADWIAHGGVTYDKPTHFEVADGTF
jgi:nucleoside-diphosphate-sugar epimerase